MAIKKSDPPKKGQKKQTNGGSTFIVFNNGRLGRMSHSGGPYVSMDTTGYGKGKKEFDLLTSNSGLTSTKKVQRKDVPATINKLKKGATKIEDRRIKAKK